MSIIFKKIPLIMHEIGAIGKDRKNPQQGYSFRGIDDVYNAVNAALSKHGVFCTPTVLDTKREERQTKQGGTLIYTMLSVKYTFYGEDGSHIDCQTIGEAMDSGDKSCNKAMSAAQKYAFLQVFCIPTEEAKDTDTETHNVAPKMPPATPPPAPKPKIGYFEIMEKERVRLGDKTYYNLLGVHGFTDPLDIKERPMQEKIYRELVNTDVKKEG